MIKKEQGYLVFNVDKNYRYKIKISNLNTVEKLSEWLCHLNEKTWFGEIEMNFMIEFCENSFGYKFNGKTNY